MSTVLGVGINQHDSCISIVRDGDTVVHCELERVLRQKRATFVDVRQCLAVVRWVMRAYHVESIDVVAIVRHMVEPMMGDLVTMMRSEFPRAQLVWSEHLDAHNGFAAVSDFDQCFSLAVDGGGDRRIRSGHPNAVLEQWVRGKSVAKRVLAPDELPIDGRVWSVVSQAIFRDEQAAGKVMGMGAYGHSQSRWKDRIRDLAAEALVWRYDDRTRDSMVDSMAVGEFQDQSDLALAVQTLYSDSLVAALRRFGVEDSPVVLTGGCALNVVANTVVNSERDGRVWIPPCPGDEGISLGAAIRTAVDCGDEVRPLKSPFLGVGESGLPSMADLRGAAEMLARGGVLVSSVGRSEIGPRALGNRSFLALPSPGNRQRVSEQMKRREWFRPVAPVLLARDMGRWLEHPIASPYMSFSGMASAEMKELCGGAVHRDGSARHQSVDDRFPYFKQLLLELEGLGVPPVLMNTSLNTNGVPICLDSSDSLATALAVGADGFISGHGFFKFGLDV